MMVTLAERYASSKGMTQAEMNAQFTRGIRNSALRTLKSKQAVREIYIVESYEPPKDLTKEEIEAVLLRNAEAAWNEWCEGE